MGVHQDSARPTPTTPTLYPSPQGGGKTQALRPIYDRPISPHPLTKESNRSSPPSQYIPIPPFTSMISPVRKLAASQAR